MAMSALFSLLETSSARLHFTARARARGGGSGVVESMVRACLSPNAPALRCFVTSASSCAPPLFGRGRRCSGSTRDGTWAGGRSTLMIWRQSRYPEPVRIGGRLLSSSSSRGGGGPGPEKAPPPKKPIKEIRARILSTLTPHENIYNVPNILTFSRLLAAPVIGYLVLHDAHAWAVGLFAYAGITDLVDGYIARRWKLQTVVGTVIDPMADKTLMTVLTVCLAIKGALPVWLATIILGRDVGLGFAALYYRYISLPPPKTFSRYWDFSLPSAEVHPTTISKFNTALQLALIGACTAQPLITADISGPMTAMQYLVASTTIWSGASYVYSKDAVKILSQEERQAPAPASQTHQSKDEKK